MKRAVVMIGLMSVCLSSVPAIAADANDGKTSAEPTIALTAGPSLMVASELPRGLRAELPRAMKRSSLLPAMYVAFGVVQAWDAYATSAALKAGAREFNPIAVPFAGDPVRMIGFKAATSAATVFFTERLGKQNRVAAVVVMAGINSGMAMVAARNARLAQAR